MRHPPARPVVTIGVFDGVHRAHQQLLRATVQLAQRLRGTSVVITFDPDPHMVLDPAHAPPSLIPLEVRLALLQACKIDRIWVIPFTKAFSRMTAAQFIDQILVRNLRATALIVGEGFLFGKNRAGDMDVLKTLGPSRGVQVIAVKQITRNRQPISSSRIRRLIAEGAIAHAKRLLGRAPAIYGTVVHGAGRGRHLGFPTANIRLTSGVLPPQGVYAVLVSCASRRHLWQGVMNLGVRPTFGPGPMVCEAHLLQFSGTLQGHSVSVSLLGRLRNEHCFTSIEELRRQISHDLARASVIFRRRT